MTFRKHTTFKPQTNVVEEFLADPGIFERELTNGKESETEKFNSHRRNIWKNQRIKTTRSTSVDVPIALTSYSSYGPTTTTTMPLKFRKQHISVTLPRISSAESQLRETESRSITPTQRERLLETTSTMKTRKATMKMTTASVWKTATTQQRTTESTKPKVTSLTSPAVDVEYEVVEVEVDENGNEILNEVAEEQSDDDIRQKLIRKSSEIHNQEISSENKLLDRKKLVKEQKHALNLSDSVEVEYFDSETTKRPNDDETIDVYDYSEENPRLK